jgi:broad specificity phosphatase PhoE
MVTPPLLYFIRHGQTDWNAEHRLQGQRDNELNEVGRGQANANGEALARLIGDGAGFDFVASPLSRTRETMERVRNSMGLPATGYSTDKRLVEINFGDWQGFTYPELEARYPNFSKRRDSAKWTIVPPGDGAESYVMLTARVRPWLENLKGPTVCVAHGGIARAIFYLAGGMRDAEAAQLLIPQDQILRVQDGRLEWL